MNTQKGLSTPPYGDIPHGMSEQQARDIVAYYWIVKPDVLYQGLKQAFSLAPKEGEILQ